MDALVWVADWQMQCCGMPFAVESEVTWTVTEPDTEWLARFLGEADAAAVTYAEDHHGYSERGLGTVRGTVRSIRAVHCQLAVRSANPRTLAPVPGSVLSVEVTQADGWESAGSGTDFCGYLVDLEQLDFRPAEHSTSESRR